MNARLRKRASWLVLIAATCCCSAARAQPDSSGPVTVDQLFLAASEERLWLARVQQERTILRHREPSGDFVASEPLNAAVSAIMAVGQEAYVLQRDGSLYRYADGWVPAVDLPKPVDLVDGVSVGGALHVLVPSVLAAQLPRYDSAAGAPTSQPFDPAEAPLSIVRYDATNWSALAACPPAASRTADAGLRPRLCAGRGGLMLFWSTTPPEAIHYARYDAASGDWQRAAEPLPVAGLAAFWVPVVNRLPTLVAHTTETGDTALRFYRLVAEGRTTADDVWEAARPELSPLPAEVGAVRPVQAFGFNQHLGLLVAGEDGTAFLRFGRFEGPPTLSTLQPPGEVQPDLLPAAFQTVRGVLMLSILIALFVFKRSTIATPAQLAAGWELATRTRRLVGCVVDLLPFSIVAAVVVRVNWLDGCRQMVAWAINPQLNETGLPETPLFLWWVLSAAGYTAYSLLMELTTGRTAAKAVLGTRLHAPDGARPAAWQIVVRNVLRFIEVLPPFWVLGFLLLVSRNRQRVGDAFANTLAVRHAPAPAASERDDSPEKPPE